MKTIFYSWQSDTPGNKAYLNKILEDFVELNTDYKLESAERNNENSPEGIDDTIIEKIRSCDYFVADVSIINPEDYGTKRLTPNPNVLFELGYASALDGVRIIRLCNGATCNDPKDLPFDIRNTRVILEKFNASHKKNIYSKISSILKIRPKIHSDTIDRIEYYLVDIKQKTHDPEFIIMNNGHEAIAGGFSVYFDSVRSWFPHLKRSVGEDHLKIVELFKKAVDEMARFKKMTPELGQESYDERFLALSQIESIGDEIANYLVENKIPQSSDYGQSVEDYYYNVGEWMKDLADEADFELPAFYKYTEGVALFYKHYIHNGKKDDHLLDVAESIQPLQKRDLQQYEIDNHIQKIQSLLKGPLSRS